MAATDWDTAPYLPEPQSDAVLIKATVAQGHTLACATAGRMPDTRTGGQRAGLWVWRRH